MLDFVNFPLSEVLYLIHIMFQELLFSLLQVVIMTDVFIGFIFKISDSG